VSLTARKAGEGPTLGQRNARRRMRSIAWKGGADPLLARGLEAYFERHQRVRFVRCSRHCPAASAAESPARRSPAPQLAGGPARLTPLAQEPVYLRDLCRVSPPAGCRWRPGCFSRPCPASPRCPRPQAPHSLSLLLRRFYRDAREGGAREGVRGRLLTSAVVVVDAGHGSPLGDRPQRGSRACLPRRSLGTVTELPTIAAKVIVIELLPGPASQRCRFGHAAGGARGSRRCAASCARPHGGVVRGRKLRVGPPRLELDREADPRRASSPWVRRRVAAALSSLTARTAHAVGRVTPRPECRERARRSFSGWSLRRSAA
jgi:hypothetical protein